MFINSFFLYIYIRMLNFRPRLNILIFLPILGWEYSCIILKLQLMPFPFLEYIGVSIIVTAGFSFCWQFLPFRKWNNSKIYNCIAFTAFEHTKIHDPFSISQPGVYSENIFLKFQPHILIKYILIEKKSVSIETDFFFWNVFPPCNSYTWLVFEVERF